MGHLRDHTSATKHFKFSLGGLQDAHEVEREREHRLQSRPVLRPPRAQPSAAWHEPYRCSGVCECHEEGPLGVTLVATEEPTEGGPERCYAGLDLGRKRLDVSLLMVDVWSLRRPLLQIRMGCARLVERFVTSDRLRGDRVDETRSVVHDQLELLGRRVAIADAQKVKRVAPLACKTNGSTPASWRSFRISLERIAPIPASSGHIVRYRVNPGGDPTQP